MLITPPHLLTFTRWCDGILVTMPPGSYYAPTHRVETLSVDGRRLSVCLSVRPPACPMPDPKSNLNGMELKIGRKEAHDTDDP